MIEENMEKPNKVNTICISDLHLSDSEDKRKHELWKKFKDKRFFLDEFFSKFLDKVSEDFKTNELILNGDIFDFDSVMSYDAKLITREYEKKFGLGSSEQKSLYKIKTIIKQHPVFFDALKKFINKGNIVVFVIGNHDLELIWLEVQKEIKNRISNDNKLKSNVVFCEWFYISNKDTLIEHGHQYDPYCMSLDPINPLVKKNGKYIVRLPFGNLANRFMINAMGLKNPHDDSNYVKSFTEFVTFFLKYELKIQPLIVFDWLNGAIKTLIYTVGESFLPNVKDPNSLHLKLKHIARKSNATTDMVLRLRENHTHPAVYNPWYIIRELWLDRAFLLLLMIILSWYVFVSIAVFISISFYWFFVPLLIGLSFFGYYATGVQSDIKNNQSLAKKNAVLSAKICKVKNVVLGHTHQPYCKKYKGCTIFNTGTWSIFFSDIECNNNISRFHFVSINSKDDSGLRESILYEYLYKTNEFVAIKKP